MAIKVTITNGYAIEFPNFSKFEAFFTNSKTLGGFNYICSGEANGEYVMFISGHFGHNHDLTFTFKTKSLEEYDAIVLFLGAENSCMFYQLRSSVKGGADPMTLMSQLLGVM